MSPKYIYIIYVCIIWLDGVYMVCTKGMDHVLCRIDRSTNTLEISCKEDITYEYKIHICYICTYDMVGWRIIYGMF